MKIVLNRLLKQIIELKKIYKFKDRYFDLFSFKKYRIWKIKKKNVYG